MSDRKNLFVQLTKYDEFRGIATGIACAEELDHDNEILDYQGSKPYIQKWSDSQLIASKGMSAGNLRLQHDSKKVVGKLNSLTFDDAGKRVMVEALVVDPVAKELLRTGCLTGFSIGGDYIKRTPLPSGAVRYIAGPSELSVCDRPCAPSALFTAVKADGSTEMRKFQKTIQPTEQPISTRIKVLKAAGYSHGMICSELSCTPGQVLKALGMQKSERVHGGFVRA